MVRGKHEIKGPGGTLPLREGDDAAADLVMLIDGETSGRPLEEILAEHGRSRSTYYEKLRRYREEGMDGLLPRAPGPRAPWRRTPRVVELIVNARLENADRSAEVIARDLQAKGVAVSVRSVERTLREHLSGRGKP